MTDAEHVEKVREAARLLNQQIKCARDAGVTIELIAHEETFVFNGATPPRIEILAHRKL